MLVTKTIRCKINNLTNIKKQILISEYNEYQKICQEVFEVIKNDYMPNKPFKMFKNEKRYESYVRGAIRTVYNIKNDSQSGKINEQPLYLHSKKLRIIKNQNKISKYWLKFPTKQKRGGIYLPIIIPYKYENLLSNKICDSQIMKIKNNWFLLLTIKKDIPMKTLYSNILAVDIGERVMATVCGSFDNQRPTFYGRDIRGIRRHYAWLRKRLGEKKKFEIIKRMGNVEQRKVNDILHKISNKIVDKAKETNSIIVLGDLKGIVKTNKGKKLNRIVRTMAHYKLSQYIKYKAEWEGIMTIKVNEAYTSQTCSHCHSQGKRPYQGLFVCNSCGYQANADYNGAKNIAQRGLEAIPLLDGVELIQPNQYQSLAPKNISGMLSLPFQQEKVVN
jgi:IS605 OrfB family transposase